MATLRILTTVLAISSLSLGALLYRKSQECADQTARLELLRSDTAALADRFADSKVHMDSLAVQLERSAFSPMDPSHVQRLQKFGIHDPVSDLITDLQRHPELIPYAGVHGSKMIFLDKDRIRVLSDAWVYAYFEDGHIAGEGIFEYKVADGGAISWRVIQSRQL